MGTLFNHIYMICQSEYPTRCMQYIKSISLCFSHSVISLQSTRVFAVFKTPQFQPLRGLSRNGTAVERILHLKLTDAEATNEKGRYRSSLIADRSLFTNSAKIRITFK